MLSVLVITISIFVFLVFVRNLQKTRENFKNKFRENFSNHSIRNVHVDTEIKEDNGTEEEEGEGTNEEGEGTNEEGEGTSEEEGIKTEQAKCDGGNQEGECLFGCGDGGVSQYSTPPKPSDNSKPANLKDMLNTFEETEKICEAIERKDKERRDRESSENLEKQLQLNKKFLIQQKAQNKQIEDLQELVKAMQFDEDMKKVAIEKCSGKADDCLSDKETRMSEILKMREARKQNMKINLNIDPFGDEFKKKLMESLKLSDSEIAKLSQAINNGELTMEQVNNGLEDQKDRQNPNSKQYDKACPNCKVNLDDFIDRCKIPCRKCRDPAWKCPQDVGGK